MIGSTRSVRVFAWRRPVDMRRGFDGLYALVLEELQHDPLSGDIFVFVSRDRRRAKALMWDGTGLCLFSKRLERGRFVRLANGENLSQLQLTVTELQLLLEGSHAVGKLPLSPAIFDTSSLASIR